MQHIPWMLVVWCATWLLWMAAHELRETKADLAEARAETARCWATVGVGATMSAGEE